MTPAGRFLSRILGICALAGVPSALILQRIFLTLIKPVLCSLIIMLLGTGFVVAAETDDASLFVEAFTAYQKKDYLLAIEKIGVIDQLFPDTPLRDVALLLLARSGFQSGDYELAASTINRFTSEFPANPLKATIEDELLHLGSRRQKGERLAPALPLLTAARKIRTEQLALEKSIASVTALGLERETPATDNQSQEAVTAVINLSGSAQTVPAGQQGEIPFEVVNLGTSEEDFMLEASAPPGYETTLSIAGQADNKPSRATIGTAAPLKGSILFRMPHDKVDGYKANVSLQVISEKQQRIVASRGTQVIAAAPLVRVIAKPNRQRLAPGERMRYHITVLNVGSLPARELTVRVLLPAQFKELDDGTTPGARADAGGITFRIDSLLSGKLVEFTLDVKVREDSPSGQELRSRVEVINHHLQLKEIFTSAVTAVEGTQ